MQALLLTLMVLSTSVMLVLVLLKHALNRIGVFLYVWPYTFPPLTGENTTVSNEVVSNEVLSLEKTPQCLMRSCLMRSSHWRKHHSV